ncbi:hypothetical protein AURDEDRAFT_166391, partial [Auricularia subglabra TFB-10046 SS5]
AFSARAQYPPEAPAENTQSFEGAAGLQYLVPAQNTAPQYAYTVDHWPGGPAPTQSFSAEVQYPPDAPAENTLPFDGGLQYADTLEQNMVPQYAYANDDWSPLPAPAQSRDGSAGLQDPADALVEQQYAQGDINGSLMPAPAETFSARVPPEAPAENTQSVDGSAGLQYLDVPAQNTAPQYAYTDDNWLEAPATARWFGAGVRYPPEAPAQNTQSFDGGAGPQYPAPLAQNMAQQHDGDIHALPPPAPAQSFGAGVRYPPEAPAENTQSFGGGAGSLYPRELPTQHMTLGHRPMRSPGCSSAFLQGGAQDVDQVRNGTRTTVNRLMAQRAAPGSRAASADYLDFRAQRVEALVSRLRESLLSSGDPRMDRNFWILLEGDAARNATSQNIFNYITSETLCLSCHHTYDIHSSEPAFLCVATREDPDACSCKRFALKTVEEFLFNCVCSCGHSYSFHQGPPSSSSHSLSTSASTSAVSPLPPPPPQPQQQPQQHQQHSTTTLFAPPLFAPAPASASALRPASSHSGPSSATSNIVPFPVALPSSDTVSRTANQQRVASYERQAQARAANANGGAIPPLGTVGSRVPPAPAATHVRPRDSAAPYPDPSTSSLAPVDIRPAKRNAKVKKPPKPQAVKVKEAHGHLLIFPFDVCQNHSAPAPYPSAATLGLSPSFTKLLVSPPAYSHLVDLMVKCGLAIPYSFSGPELDPPNFYRNVHALIRSHLASLNFTMYFSGPAPHPNIALWRTLIPHKVGSPAKPTYRLNGALPDVLFSPLDVPVASAGLIHHCLGIRQFEFFTSESSNPTPPTPGRCAAICGAIAQAAQATNITDATCTPQSSTSVPSTSASTSSRSVVPFVPPATLLSSPPRDAASLIHQLSGIVRQPQVPPVDLHRDIQRTPSRPAPAATGSPSRPISVISRDSTPDAPSRIARFLRSPPDSASPDIVVSLPVVDWESPTRKFLAALQKRALALPSTAANRAYLQYYPTTADTPHSLGTVMSSIFHMLLNSTLDADDIAERLEEQFTQDVVRSDQLSLRRLFGCDTNIFKLGKGLGPGPERTAIAETLDALTPPALWHTQGDYRVPRLPAWSTPSKTDLDAFRACGLACVWALIRIGQIPLLHPLFLFLLLVSTYLGLPVNHPTVLSLLSDIHLVAALAPESKGPLSLYPPHHSDRLPPENSGPDAAALWDRLRSLEFDPSSPRTEAVHEQIRQALFSVALLGIPLARSAVPQEWLAFLEGFNFNVSFRSGPKLVDIFISSATRSAGTDEPPLVIHQLKHILRGLSCPSATRPDILDRLHVELPDDVSDADTEVAFDVLSLITNYLSGDAHPRPLLHLFPLDPDRRSPTLRPMLFAACVTGSPYLSPAPQHASQKHDTRFEARPVIFIPPTYLSCPTLQLSFTFSPTHLAADFTGVPPMRFTTCLRSVVIYVNPAFRALVLRSQQQINAHAHAHPDALPCDTDFDVYLHSQLVSESSASAFDVL